QIVVLDGAGNPRVLASGADGQAAPVWRSDGAALAYRRWRDAAPRIAVVETGGEGQTTEYAWPGALHLSAVGWDGEGRLLAVAMAPGGFDLVALTEGRLLAHLSDGPARGFALSPDRRQLSYLTDLTDRGANLRTLRLGGAFAAASFERQLGGVFGAVWRPDGALVTGGAVEGLRSLSFGGQPGELAQVEPLVSAQRDAVDVPVAAGPSGWVALRRLVGANPAQPTHERLLLVGPGGSVPLMADGPLEAVGWIVEP
ncbi:MAG: hypothetical protein NTZ05_02745, partial [Chloroflexi bacterium]|nr:hypothetical protein [Chloroflexota bacterium]